MLRRSVARLMIALALTALNADAQQRWTVDSVPILDIGGTDSSGAPRFGVAAGATRLPNGTIAIADVSTLTVRFFSPTGRLTRSVGRAGQGPGEFRSMQWIGSCGSDSVYVWDLGFQRMSVIGGASGEVARQFRIPAEGTTAPRPFTLTCSSQRTFAYTSVPTAREPTGEEYIVRGAAPLVIADADGKPVRQVASVMSSELAAMGGAGFPRPLGKATTFAVGGDRVYVGTGDSAVVDAYLADGTKRTIRLDIPVRPSTRENMEQAIEAITGLAPPAARGRASAQLRELRMPPTLPPYSALLSDPDGLLWVVRSFPGDSTTALSAIGPTGTVAGDVVIHRPLRVFEIGRDYILAAWDDARAEPHVGVLRLRR